VVGELETPMSLPSVLDLFSGCGGLSKGFDQAGFTIVAANEQWHLAARSFKANHKQTIVIEGDVADAVVQKRIFEAVNGRVDVIIGGPPCQAYSLAGRRDSTDLRGRLFEQYVSLVAQLRPKIFVMENVKGLLSIMHDRPNLREDQRKSLAKLRSELALLPDKYTRQYESRDALEAGRERASDLRKELKSFQEPVTAMIVRSFREVGYDVAFRVLNAAHYGVPQKRERVVFVGHRTSREPLFPCPTHSADDATSLFGNALLPFQTVRQAVEDLKDAPEAEDLHHIYPRHSPEFIEKIKRTPVGASVFRSYGDAFFRCPPDEPARTVKENHNGVFVHYSEHRVMTPRELARLQDFGDDFRFVGSKSAVLKLIGNAVPVGLARAIGAVVREMLN
jgi:DNA (cytosine-5)-methyltransferase 1